MLDTAKMEARREELGLTQEQAAAAAGMSGKQQWWNVVRGGKSNVTLDVLANIAAALELDPCDLLLRDRTGGRKSAQHTAGRKRSQGRGRQ